MTVNRDQIGVTPGIDSHAACVHPTGSASGGPSGGIPAFGRGPILLIAALCAGISFPAAVLVENIRDTFRMPAKYDKYSQPPPEVLGPMLAAARSAQRKNAALVFGVCGALLCGVIGASAGWAGRSLPSTVVGALDGIVVGGLGGALGGVGNALLSQQFTESGMDELFQAMIVHLPAWLLIGISAGAVICAVNKSRLAVGQMLIAGVGAALLSVAMFPLISSQLFPDAHPAMRFPDSFGSLVLWIGLSNGLIALAVMRAARRRSDAAAGPNSTSPTSL